MRTDQPDVQGLILEGNALEDSGRIAEALARYDEAARLAPGLARAQLNRGNALLAMGDAAQAADAYARAIAQDRDYAPAHFNLGNAYVRIGRHEEALAAYRHALKVKPDFADAHVALGALFQDMGQPEAAAASYRRALAIDPGYAAVHANLGNVLQGLQQFDEAIASYRRALEADPGQALVHFHLGNALRARGCHEEAIAAYREALVARPDWALAHAGMGASLHALRRDYESIASYRRATEIEPGAANLFFRLGLVLQEVGDLEGAIGSFRRAVELAGDFDDARSSLAQALLRTRDYAGAAACFQALVARNPRSVDLQYNLAAARHLQGSLDLAVLAYRQVLELEPRHAHAYNNLSQTLKDLGRYEEALASCEKALEIDPEFEAARSNRLFILNYLADRPGPVLLAQAKAYGEMVARRAKPFFTWPSNLDSERKLRIGFVSGDLREHPVGYFSAAIFEALSKSRQLELVGYPTVAAADAMTADIRRSFHVWRIAAGLDDAALASAIRQDSVDILIDLSGHTASNRLPVFAWKPAPVQATWLGYFATTGVAAIDYLIADPWALAPGEEASFTEEVWRLPETRLCYTELTDSPAVSPLTAIEAGHVTFGCFNTLAKVNDDVVALWARILSAVRGSRLFLKSKPLVDAMVQERTLARFAVHGIGPERLILEGASPRREYLAAYKRVDIALDPFPYTGGATTVEALWMGIPVLTLAGRSLLSRQGVGFLMNAGLRDWIATDEDDYTGRAAAHAGDLRSLAQLRAGLREQVRTSPIFDAGRFAGHFESALRGMWRRFCAART